MKIRLNGEQAELSPEIRSLEDLLNHYSIHKERTAVELNGQIIAAVDYAQTRLEQDDSLEIVTFVGGG